jgi:hypothetical protein
MVRKPTHVDLESVAAEALAIGDVASAVIFVDGPASGALDLAAAAGIDGPPLDGLVAAVQSPEHPVNRAFDDAAATFDVRPINPGGPALRSHLPIRQPARSGSRAVGVLAVAHERHTTDADRRRLGDLADRAAAALESPAPTLE